jgi:hypothetical protein
LRQLEISRPESHNTATLDVPLITDLSKQVTFPSSGSLDSRVFIDAAIHSPAQDVIRAAESLLARTGKAYLLQGTTTRDYETRLDAMQGMYGRVVRSTFDEVYASRLNAANSWLSRARATHQPRARREILDRLDDLLAETAQTGDEDVPTRQSLDSAAEFFSSRSDLSQPMLSVTPNGNVWAEWAGANGRRVALEFLGNGSVNLAAIFPDSERMWRKDSFAANLSKAAASAQIRNNAELHWLVEQRG